MEKNNLIFYLNLLVGGGGFYFKSIGGTPKFHGRSAPPQETLFSGIALKTEH
jgi:hypothetical protein